MSISWHLVDTTNKKVKPCNDILDKVIAELLRLQIVSPVTKIKVFKNFINFETPRFDDDKLFYCYMSMEKFLFTVFKVHTELKISLFHYDKIHNIDWEIYIDSPYIIFGVDSMHLIEMIE